MHRLDINRNPQFYNYNRKIRLRLLLGLTSVVYNSDAYAMDIFRRCSISDFTFGGSAVPESMASIFGILDLQRLTLTDNVTSIGKEAFRGCSGINSIEIPNSVNHNR